MASPSEALGAPPTPIPALDLTAEILRELQRIRFVLEVAFSLELGHDQTKMEIDPHEN